MKDNIKILFLIILGIAMGFLVFTIGKNNQKNSLTDKQVQSVQKVGKESSGYAKQEAQNAEVAVEVIPLKLSSEENTEFDISLSTHSVNLDKSLKEISVLEDDKGNIYNPISWSGEIGGHHAKGNLVFPPFSKDAKSIKLTIEQIGKADRIFNWVLK
ncbi:MAG: hypothetical protein A3C22_00105 [Candidatus Levybacteria bacterium RIFCSPHIGHO2_02_FULL_37_10]|nr:MAG: hypothetical protein A3C22_00105 [Candidatus Levybacteria bacterium RIFCSPHIGHO2_02_FULL_37_10]OGH42493.1 MAG: hypothetical protein A3H79_01455 [Candidatus Levybacteria bacterium RIFCSPLOWO2_02_FULL_36_8b]